MGLGTRLVAAFYFHVGTNKVLSSSGPTTTPILAAITGRKARWDSGHVNLSLGSMFRHFITMFG
jgi:hypothetical protein